MVALLLSGRFGVAEPNVPNTMTGATPLHLAAKAGCLESIKLLCDTGADVWAETRHGESVQSFAVQAGHMACAMWLEHRGR